MGLGNRRLEVPSTLQTCPLSQRLRLRVPPEIEQLHQFGGVHDISDHLSLAQSFFQVTNRKRQARVC